MIRKTWFLSGAFALISLVSPGQLQATALADQERRPPDRGDQVAPSFELSDREHKMASELAWRALREKRLQTDSPIYLILSEPVRVKDERGEEADRRLARVIHYRYEGDLGILTLVDLAQREVIEVETIPHLPLPLAEEEFEIATELALADERVQKELGEMADRVHTEALLIRAASEEDPLFGHRVVRLLFRVERDYLSEPIVEVDLTARKVTVREKLQVE